MIFVSGINELIDYKYNEYIDNSNRLINLQIEESFIYFYDHLEEWHCQGEEDYLRIVFEDFFVDRFGTEECKKKIRAVYDYICSPAYFNYIEPIYAYILYKVINNMIKDFKECDGKLFTEWFIKRANDNEQVNNRYEQMTFLYKAIEDYYNVSIRNIQDRELKEEIENIHYLVSLGISEMDVLFEDLDFEPDFLDYVISDYIQDGGNQEGIDHYWGMNLNEYTDCMRAATLEMFNKCQSGNEQNNNENANTDILRNPDNKEDKLLDIDRIRFANNGVKVKYSIFVSSTYEDLKDERIALMTVLLEKDFIPVGMEQFHAVPASQWDVIKRMIDDCDYYLLIIGGRYGSIDADTDLSYTEKEYRYAKENSIPVIAFLPKNPNDITKAKMDKDDWAIKQEKLDAFKKKVVEEDNTVDYYEDSNDLKYVVSASLSRLIEFAPRDGWVRRSMLETYMNNNNNLNAQLEEMKAEVKRLRMEIQSKSSVYIGDKEPADMKENDIWISTTKE